VSADIGKVRRDVAEEQAKARGCVIIEPKPNELFLDIDSADDMAYFEKQIKRVAVRWKCTWTASESPGGKMGRYHVYVTFFDRELDHWQRIALQAVLGSDRVRELISVQRLLDGDAAPTLFFEKPEQVRLRAMESPVPGKR
jgi:hypothetical protein